MRAHRRFRAMGTDCEVTVFAAEPIAEMLVDAAVTRIALLEDCWSRFRPASELNRLNARAGQGPVPVSDDLLDLVTTMRSAWEMTDGRFDPTVLHSMQALGYDADFAEVIARTGIESMLAETRPAPGMADVVVDAAAGTIALPAGVGLDPGAIGKGLAADIIVDELLDAGAVGVLVSLGGDIVLAGSPDDEPQWLVSVVDERCAPSADAPVRPLRTLAFAPGTDPVGIATSTTARRRWGAGRHHLVDPRTGTMAEPELVQATVVADAGWRAEASATSALLLDAAAARDWLADQDLAGLLITPDLVIDARRRPADRTLAGAHHA